MSLQDIQKREYKVLVIFDEICRKHNIQYSLAWGTLLGAVRHQGFIPWDDDVDVTMLRDEYNKFKNVIDEELAQNPAWKNISLQCHDTEKYYMSQIPRLIESSDEVQDLYSQHLPNTKGYFIDIFPVDKLPKDEKDQKALFTKLIWINYFFGFFYYKHTYPKNSLVKKITQNTMNTLNTQTYRLNKFFTRLFKEQEALQEKYNKTDSQVVSALCQPPLDYETRIIFKQAELEDLIELQFEDQKFFAPRDYDSILKRTYGDYMKLPPEEERHRHIDTA